MPMPTPPTLQALLPAALALLLGLAGCASPAPPACPAGEQAVAVHTLYFGRSRAAGAPVSQQEWQAFVDEQVTPRFMDGLTQWAAQGQWRNIHTARIQREDSFVLQLVVPGAANARPKLQEIMAAYRTRFQQQAVLHVAGAACANL